MFSKAINLFSISGFQIKVDASWLLIATLITWGLAKHYFPYSFPSQSAQTYLIMSIVTMLCFFATLLLHEIAHSVVARRFGIPIKGITLFLFGGVAELNAEPQSARAEFWVALAGPVMSLALSFGFWGLASILELVLANRAVLEILSYLAIINLVLALFNLIPAFPLDGGRILRAYLWHRKKNLLRATEIASKFGEGFAYVLMALGVFSLLQGALVGGLWYMLIGTFVLTAARSSYQSQLAQTVFAFKSVGDLMTRDPVVVAPHITLSDFVNTIMLQNRIGFVPVVESGVLLGHINPSVLAAIDRENWSSTQVGDVFVGLDYTQTVSPDMPVQDLLAIISKTGRRKFMVVQHQQLRGVITLADLTGYLRLSETLQPH
ncbi:MAG: site-2 protease family protein [Roseovarius sp.]